MRTDSPGICIRKLDLEKLSEFSEDIKLINNKTGITTQTITQPGAELLGSVTLGRFKNFISAAVTHEKVNELNY